DEALEAFQLCARKEGILPALEPSHALARTVEKAAEMSADEVILMNMCGRGDKDIFTVADALGVKI
ncbi:MAG: tryptophan synthase subunit beta, partial [Pseudomonadota bacterium]